jgi:antitoxin component YwqK of YwqJK toxin-antitoxin module
MSILHDAYTALLAGLTHKIGNEIHWYDEYDNPLTIEPIDMKHGIYVVRYYYANGQKQSEMSYKNNKRYGKYLRWYDNGQKWWEYEYQNDLARGKALGWYENGQKHYEVEYQDSERHGKSIVWKEDGQKYREEEYENGELIRTIL